MESEKELNSSDCQALELFSKELSDNLINTVFFYKTTHDFMEILFEYLIHLDKYI